MATEISNTYDPKAVERHWYSQWLAHGCFAGRADPARPAYSIVIPPPNVTGVLTMGHVLNNTIQDILIRRARQEGHATCWIPGTDHAGIATQNVVEKTLRKDGKTRWDFGREKFVERVWEWREKYGNIIIEQLKGLGASCDWDRTAFTMDPAYSRRVLQVFVELFNRGHIYRGKRMVNWCPVSLTALSDEEVTMKPQKGMLTKVRYEIVERPGEFIHVATTRPETIPGDTAIAVNPADPRYAGLVGLHVWRPLVRAPIPIIADTAVDPAFGAGALKVTPAHDKVDYEIGQRHKLPAIDVLEPNGKLNEFAGPGLDGGERFGDRVGVAGHISSVGELQVGERLDVELGVILRADRPRGLTNGDRPESCARAKADPTVEWRTEYRDVATIDVAQLRQAHERR